MYSISGKSGTLRREVQAGATLKSSGSSVALAWTVQDSDHSKFRETNEESACGREFRKFRYTNKTVQENTTTRCRL
jgi:hypothetical protein